MLEDSEDSIPLDDLEHYHGRLKETLDRLISLDDSIHELLPDKESEEDVHTCDEYINKTKRASQRASRRIDSSLSVSTTRLSINGPTQQPAPALTGFLTFGEAASHKIGTVQRRRGNLVMILCTVSVIHR